MVNSEIPRGNTCPGVNRAIINYLLSHAGDSPPTRFLDIPCGDGSFLKTLAEIFPQSTSVGCDLHAPAHCLPGDFVSVDARLGLNLNADSQFDVITCISGVMEFDNTLRFFSGLRQYLDDNGRLFVTNDNVISVPDRLLYLLLGRVRQYRLFTDPATPTWKLVTIQSLVRILNDAGFMIDDIQYIEPSVKDWLWLPLALPLYLCQLFYMNRIPRALSRLERYRMFPFRALCSRHYIVICRR